MSASLHAEPGPVESPDPASIERFANDLVESYNRAALTLMVSVGHRTGLFDAMAHQTAMTSDALATRSGLVERYVREWLAAMVTGGVVLYDPDANTYSLPAAHAAVLTRANPQDNLGTLAQYIAVLGSVETDVVACFERGGGVPYERFDRFHEVMAEDSGQSVLPVLLDQILPLESGLVAKLEAGARVLDIGCGSGRALALMAAQFPRSEFTGYDLCAETIAAAKAERPDLMNLRFEQRDVAALDATSEYDLVTAFDAIHDQAQPMAVLRNIAQALKPNGLFLMQDIRTSSHLERNIDHPLGPFLYTISCMHCMTVSLAQCGCGLGTCWGEELALEMLAVAGFTDVRCRQLPHDIQNQFYLCRLA